MWRKGVWFIIAGVLLLGQTSALAESYLRIRKNGVTYYYFFNSRKSSLSRPGGMNKTVGPDLPRTPLLRPVSGRHATLATVPAPSRHPAIMAKPRQIIKPPDTKACLWAGSHYLFGLLTKLGYRHPPVLPVSEAGCQLQEHRRSATIIQEAAVSPGVGVSDPLRDIRGKRRQGVNGWNRADYCFPVSGRFSFRNSWNDYRPGGRRHHAVDIMAREGTPVYAVTAGVIDTLVTWPRAGITLMLQGWDGRGYGYMHLRGYARGVVQGKVVQKGELLGYVGHTGVRSSTSHLHFEIYADHRFKKPSRLNPYYMLVRLCGGVGVTDLHQHRIAFRKDPQINVKKYWLTGVLERQIYGPKVVKIGLRTPHD